MATNKGFEQPLLFQIAGEPGLDQPSLFGQAQVPETRSPVESLRSDGKKTKRTGPHQHITPEQRRENTANGVRNGRSNNSLATTNWWDRE